MRTSLKCFVFYLIVGVILLNLYFLGQLYLQNQTNVDNDQQQIQIQRKSNEFFHKHEHIEEKSKEFLVPIRSAKNKNEFLVLDWTGHQHIFREQDPIQCEKKKKKKKHISFFIFRR